METEGERYDRGSKRRARIASRDAIRCGITLWFLLILAVSRSAAAHSYKDYFADGCCYHKMTDCVARPMHPEARCRSGHRSTGVESEFSLGCIGVACIGGAGECEPDVPTGSVTELPNGIDDDCDGYIDDEQCDGKDNDGDGAVDEDQGSCMARVLVVPLCWKADQAALERAARDQLKLFWNRAGVEQCTDNFRLEFVNMSDVNLPCGCQDDVWLEQIRAHLAKPGSPNADDFDLIFALTDGDVCGDTVGRNNGSFLWGETVDATIFTHEFGHSLGLVDEYCSQRAGGVNFCSTGSPPAPPPVNFLGADLGCSAEKDAGCCGDCSKDDGYGVCCEGNRNPMGGRCVMSYSGSEGPHAYCTRCAAHIQSPPVARSETQPGGQVPMDCSYAHIGGRHFLELDHEISESGQLRVRSHRIGFGRLGVGEHTSSGQYALEVASPSGQLLDVLGANLHFGGVEGTARRFLMRRALVPDNTSSSEALVIRSRKDGILVSKTTLNGTAPLANAGPPQFAECQFAGSALASVDGSKSNDADGDTLTYRWFEPSIFDDATARSPTGIFPLGSTIVSLIVSDGVLDSSASATTVNVVDTTKPIISCADVDIECSGPQTPVQVACSADDDCDSGIEAAHNAGISYAPGKYSFNCGAVDASGNGSSATCGIVVRDTTPPTISVSPDSRISTCNPDVQLVRLPTPQVADACSAASISGQLIAVDGKPLRSALALGAAGEILLRPGTATIRWTALDEWGNYSHVDQQFDIRAEESTLCCASGQQVIHGTALPDFFVHPAGNVCVFGLESGDFVLSGSGKAVLLGGLGDDTLQGGAGQDVLYGGDGIDMLSGGQGGVLTVHGAAGGDMIQALHSASAELWGGEGADVVTGSMGPDRIFPGMGRDTVTAGLGDDTVVLFSACEASAGKVLDGGLGDDTLVIPVPFEQLQALGVVVVGFERVIEERNQEHLAPCF